MTILTKIYYLIIKITIIIRVLNPELSPDYLYVGYLYIFIRGDGHITYMLIFITLYYYYYYYYHLYY